MPRGSALAASLVNLAALTDAGMLAHTAATTWAARTIAGTADQITVTKGDGVSGAPTISLPTTIQVAGVMARTDSLTFTIGTDDGDDVLITNGSATILAVEGDNARVGIGTADPEAGFHYDGATANFTNGANSYPTINLHRADSVIGNAQAIGLLQFTGDDASSVNSPGIMIVANAEGGWSSGSTPARFRVLTCPSGSETPEERMRWFSTGDVSLGTTGGPSANGGKVLSFGDNAADPTMAAETAGIYAKDVAGTVEMFAVDEAGNASQLTTHSQTTGEVIHRSVNYYTGRRPTIYHERIAAVVAQLAEAAGIEHEPLMTVSWLPKAERLVWDDVQAQNTARRADDIAAWDELSESDRGGEPRPSEYVPRAKPIYVPE